MPCAWPLKARPTGEPWTYRFVLEVEHRAGDAAMREALGEIEASAQWVRNVGTYPTPTARL